MTGCWRTCGDAGLNCRFGGELFVYLRLVPVESSGVREWKGWIGRRSRYLQEGLGALAWGGVEVGAVEGRKSGKLSESRWGNEWWKKTIFTSVTKRLLILTIDTTYRTIELMNGSNSGPLSQIRYIILHFVNRREVMHHPSLCLITLTFFFNPVCQWINMSWRNDCPWRWSCPCLARMENRDCIAEMFFWNID